MGDIINVLDWYHGQRTTRLINLRLTAAGDERLQSELAGELSGFIERWLPLVNHMKRQRIKERESAQAHEPL